MEPSIILCITGCKTSETVLTIVRDVLSHPTAKDLVAYIKISDALHGAQISGPELVRKVKSEIKIAGSSAKIFLDMKLSGTGVANFNLLRHYSPEAYRPDVVSVRSTCSLAGFLSVREILGNIKVALTGPLFDVSKSECMRRFNLSPDQKLCNDGQALLEEAAFNGEPEPFDLVMCHGYDLPYLVDRWPNHPPIIATEVSENWDEVDVDKFIGVKEVLNMGAYLLVMDYRDFLKTIDQTKLEIQKSWRLKQGGDVLSTLINLQGYYSCEDDRGRILGPLVAYAGKDETGKNFVGTRYFNLSVLENYPALMYLFAENLANEILDICDPDVIVGVPTGGSHWGQMVALALECRFVDITKVKVSQTDATSGQREDFKFEVKRHPILPSDKVVIVEDLANNFSSTSKVVAAVEEAGGLVKALACVVNRSVTLVGDDWEGYPVVSLARKPTEQYRQDDSRVVEVVQAENIVWKAKEEWPKLKAAMEKNNINC